MSVPFSFSVIESKNPHVPKNQTFTYHTQDISGGGLRFETHLELSSGDLLNLTLMLPGLDPVKVSARVVWCQSIQNSKGESTFEGGIEFIDIDEEEQDRIIGFMFRAQIEARKKDQTKGPRQIDLD